MQYQYFRSNLQPCFRHHPALLLKSSDSCESHTVACACLHEHQAHKLDTQILKPLAHADSRDGSSLRSSAVKSFQSSRPRPSCIFASSSDTGTSKPSSSSLLSSSLTVLDPFRRAVLLAGASGLLLLLPPDGLPGAGFCFPATARLLHSKRSETPCNLTVRNRSPRPVEARWVNYDGDEEPYATIPPGHAWTVETYETHPWRFRDARTGDLLCEYVAQRGERLLQLYDDPAGLLDLNPGSSSSSTSTSNNNYNMGGGDGSDGSSSGDARTALDNEVDASGEWRRRQRHQRRQQQYGEPRPDAEAGHVTTASISPHPSLSKPLSQRSAEELTQQELQSPSQSKSAPPPTAAPNTAAVAAAKDSEQPGLAGGFDGLGNSVEQYKLASLLSVAVLPQESQAVVILGLDGYEHPLSLLVGVPEARNIVNAAGAARGRRPTLLATWARTLQALGGTLERVVITRQVGDIFYARIVLSQPWRGLPPTSPSVSRARQQPPGRADGGVEGEGFVVSVDARPSDALALALEAGAEVFVSLPVAELVQQQYLDAEKDLTDQLLTPLQQREGEASDGLGGSFLEAGGLLGAPSA